MNKELEVAKKAEKQADLVETFGFPDCPKTLKLGKKNEELKEEVSGLKKMKEG